MSLEGLTETGIVRILLKTEVEDLRHKIEQKVGSAAFRPYETLRIQALLVALHHFEDLLVSHVRLMAHEGTSGAFEEI